MIKKLIFAAIFMVAGSFSTHAFAVEELGEQGQLAVGAERIFGFNYWRGRRGEGKTEDEFGLSIGYSSPWVMLYAPPRMSFDYFVLRGLSLGGHVGFYKEEDISLLTFAPRFGYNTYLGKGFSLWLRGGVGWARYYTSCQYEPRCKKTDHSAASLEAAFVGSPFKGFGILVAPGVDVGLVGQSSDIFNLNFGLIGWF